MNIKIFNKYEFEETLMNEYKDKDINIISIGDPGEKEPKCLFSGQRKVLRLEFWDMEEDHEAAKDARTVEQDDIHKVLTFFERIRTNNNDLLIHCHAGISRSTAIALIILFVLKKSEVEAIRELLLIRPKALPNKTILKHADSILGTSLKQSVERIYRARARDILRKAFSNNPPYKL